MSAGRLAIALLVSALGATAAVAQPNDPFRGNADEGHAMHERDCVACHVRRVGGDGSAMYTRPDRRVTDAAKLKAQIAYCNTELGTRYFPDEEEHLAAFLNARYYRFPN